MEINSLQPIITTPVDDKVSTSTPFLCINPGLMIPDDDDVSYCFDTTVQNDFSDDDIFEVNTIDMVPTVAVNVARGPQVCEFEELFFDALSTLPEGEDDVFYDAIFTLSEGENHTLDTLPSPPQHTFAHLAFSLFLLSFYSRPSLSLSVLLMASFWHASSFCIECAVWSKVVQNGVSSKHWCFAYPCVLMILSCVMLKMQFVRDVWKRAYLGTPVSVSSVIKNRFFKFLKTPLTTKNFHQI